MKKLTFLLSCLLVWVMISPFHVHADGAEIIEIEKHPMLMYDVARLTVAYGSELSGSELSIYRIQDEGEFLYYTYSAGWTEAMTEVQFLLKEGEYCLKAEVPSADFPEKTIFELPFTIDDPDMDEMQSFDRTEMYILLRCDNTVSENTLHNPAQEIRNRIIEKNLVYTIARRMISIGDLVQDDVINAGDAALILQCSAEMGAGAVNSFSSLQVLEADVDQNGICNAEDATIILRYSAEVAAGNYTGEFKNYLQKS
ncbi:MAG: dockerin type I domain-containing protein [Oscillospiraceae bacterium]